MCKNNRFPGLVLLLALILMFSFIMGCSSKNNNGINSTSNEVKAAADNNSGFGAHGKDVTVEFSKSMPQKNLNSPEIEAESSGKTQVNPETAAINRKIVMTGNMEIETNRFDKAVASISKIAKQSGGYIENSNFSGSKAADRDFLENRAANFVLRIPSSKFENTIASMGDLGTIISKTTNGEDVTYQFYDNEARLKTLRTKEARILEILKKVKNMQDVLAVENELQNTTYEIESLTGTQKKLSNLVEFSTLTISVREVYEAKKLVKKPQTLLERIEYSFKESMNLLIDLIKATIVIFVAVLPFAVLLSILFIIFWYFYRKKMKNKGNDNTKNS